MGKPEEAEWGDIYRGLIEASMDAAQWPVVIEHIGRWLHADGCELLAWDTADESCRLNAYTGPIAWAQGSHQLALHSRLGEHAVVRAPDPTFVARRAACRACPRRARGERCGHRAANPAPCDIELGLLRDPLHAPFSALEAARLQRLGPALEHAVRLYMHCEDLRDAAQWGEIALDALDDGILIIDQQRQLHYANKRAEAILSTERYLRMQERVLQTANGAESASLFEAQMRVERSGNACGVRLYGTQPGTEGKTPCYVTLTRGGSVAQRVGSTAECVVLMINLPGQQRYVTPQRLRELFRLTSAEARAARALLEGMTPEEYAHNAALSIATVRTQIRAVLNKAGLDRVADLLRILARLPSAR